MPSRPVPLYAASVIVLCSLGISGYVYWSGHQKSSTAPGRLSGTVTHSNTDRDSSHSALWLLLPQGSSTRLAWSPMADLHRPAKRTGRHRIEITRVSVPAPLNLQLPADMATDANLDSTAAASASRSRDESDGTRQTLVINLNPNIDDQADDLKDDTHLFNRSNGLRGFMAENWLNKNVGLQGGLAIKEDRIRDEDSGLRDNMAVGMGVLFAF